MLKSALRYYPSKIYNNMIEDKCFQLFNLYTQGAHLRVESICIPDEKKKQNKTKQKNKTKKKKKTIILSIYYKDYIS